MRSDSKAQVEVAYDSFAFNQKGDRPRPEELSDNLTEQLVQAEIERQFAALPYKVALYIRKADVMAYALNRLPALYASTWRGREKQQTYADDNLYPEIKVVVQRAIAAVTNDPLRTQGDGWCPAESPETEAVLAELRKVLKFDCSWDNLADVVKYRLTQAARGEFYLDSTEFMDWEQYPLHQQ